MIKDFRFVYPLKPSSSRSSVPVIYPFRSKATVYTSIGAGSDSAVNKKLQVIDPLKASNSKQSKQVIYTLLDKSNGYRTAMKQAERRSGAKAVKASRVATPLKDSYAGDSDKKVYSLKNKSIPGIVKHRNNGKKDKVYRLTTFLRGSDIIRLFGGNQSKVTAVNDGTSTLN
ncbi:hypothetical protein OESDEN_11783 [Oesophagostomum dentatum]|uniref:Uncharacterized protein n=1 Tax=Oesophagostomum dentatum TaxID=61180 RepID=A0A0B1STY3_OESDE|nr:hypothetical protein OESDEN_11783 [Oesophagostomum dentatum]